MKTIIDAVSQAIVRKLLDTPSFMTSLKNRKMKPTSWRRLSMPSVKPSWGNCWTLRHSWLLWKTERWSRPTAQRLELQRERHQLERREREAAIERDRVMTQLMLQLLGDKLYAYLWIVLHIQLLLRYRTLLTRDRSRHVLSPGWYNE